MRSALAQIRQSRVAPSAINAPTAGFVPRSSGVGTPAQSINNNISSTAVSDATPGTSSSNSSPAQQQNKWGLQEERINRDAWKGMLDALSRLRAIRERNRQAELSRMQSD